MILSWRTVAPFENGPAILTSLTEAEIMRLCGLGGGRRVLEIGTAYGYTAVSLALYGANVVTIDPHAGENPGSLEGLREVLKACDIEQLVVPIVGRSEDIVPQLRTIGATFDLVFIDGDHSEAAVAKDLFHAQRVLSRNGFVACHDYGEDSCPGVKAALDKSGLPPLGIVDTLWII